MRKKKISNVLRKRFRSALQPRKKTRPKWKYSEDGFS